MAESIQDGLVQATQVAREAVVRQSANSVYFAAFGETSLDDADLVRIVQAIPSTVAAALARKTYFFVPLAMAESRGAEPVGHRSGNEETMISPVYTAELADLAICHRNVALEAGVGISTGVQTGEEAREGVFISTRLLNDRFSLAFELFINVGHAFVDVAGVPQSFSDLAWSQAVADVRGETSQDAWESRAQAVGTGQKASPRDGKPRIDEKAKMDFLEAAFSDAIAIYLLSLSVDFDYSELREREYPLLAPQALAARLRLVAQLFPPNPAYEFAIRYRRRA
ncbi:MAG: hypothetical protein P4K80_04345 [Acidobacteriaceae bacterium]|nr:hypothetical protein [Acidobacteriaceae bacterium]